MQRHCGLNLWTSTLNPLWSFTARDLCKWTFSLSYHALFSNVLEPFVRIQVHFDLDPYQSENGHLLPMHLWRLTDEGVRFDNLLAGNRIGMYSMYMYVNAMKKVLLWYNCGLTPHEVKSCANSFYGPVCQGVLKLDHDTCLHHSFFEHLFYNLFYTLLRGFFNCVICDCYPSSSADSRPYSERLKCPLQPSPYVFFLLKLSLIQIML